VRPLLNGLWPWIIRVAERNSLSYAIIVSVDNGEGLSASFSIVVIVFVVSTADKAARSWSTK
jgi:hypothetical protein